MTRPHAIETARRMHAGGWKIEEIRRYLAKRGQSVAWVQVKGWVDPEYAEQRKQRQRRRMREAYRRKHNTQPHNYRHHDDILDVLHVLRIEDGLTYTALAAVARRLYGLDVTDYTIRSELLKRGVEKNPNKARAAREQHQRAIA